MNPVNLLKGHAGRWCDDCRASQRFSAAWVDYLTLGYVCQYPSDKYFRDNATARMVRVKELQMTDEKKPPQGAVVGARIVLELAVDGAVSMRAEWLGAPDCVYAGRSDARLLGFDLPCLLAELRLQLKLGRRCTVAESADIAAQLRQSSLGSNVTV